MFQWIRVQLSECYVMSAWFLVKQTRVPLSSGISLLHRSIWIWCKRTVRCEFIAYEFHTWCLFCFIHIRACAFPFHFIFTWCTRAFLQQFQSSRSFTDCCCYFIDHTTVYECCIASHWASIQFTAHSSSFVNFFPSNKKTKAMRRNEEGVGWGKEREKEWNDVTVY